MKKQTLSRRFFLFLIMVAFCVYFFLPRKPKMYLTEKKLVIIGFDGADPQLVERWWDDLPNLRALAKKGTYNHMTTSQPPESPVAWSCFAIGANPGQHGVYDFLRRPHGTYTPTEEAFVQRRLPKFLFNMLPIRMPAALPRRGGKAFWDVLSDHGVRTTMIEVPVTFPPPQLNYGEVLSGLGVPCIRGTQATFHQFRFDEQPNPDDPTESTMGGKIEILQKDGDTYRGNIWGPYDPIFDYNKQIKKKEELLANLEYFEWQAQLFSIWGKKHISQADQEDFINKFGISVIHDLSYFTYLQDSDTLARVEKLKAFTQTWENFYVDKNKSANEIRSKIMRGLIERSKQLKEELTESKPILTPVFIKKIEAHSVSITVGKQTQTVPIGGWSDWFTVTFTVNSIIKLTAICKFYLQQVSPNLHVYMTSPDIDPRNAAIPISHPGNYAEKLVEWTGGLYKTRGWAAETHAVMDGYLEEEPFLEDLLALMEQREKKLFETMERTDSNVVVSVFSETDRISHLFMYHIDPEHPMHDPELAKRYGDYIKRIYLRMDEIVGRLRQKIATDPDTTLIVMSDHGFAPWRYQVNLNTWLHRNQFMTLTQDYALQGKKLEDLLNKHTFKLFEGVDWLRTKAYALGLGQIYINLKGREPIGSVDPQDYDKVCDEIVQQLSTLTDPRHGDQPVFAYVKKRSDIWSGPYADDEHDCPDIQVGFKRGYRVSWQTCLGSIEPEIIFDNNAKWSGDHCSMGRDEVPGMFFCDKEINTKNPSLFDISPTVLSQFNLPIPEAVEGHTLFS